MDVVFRSALEQQRMIASKEISAVELLEAHLDQIERVNPSVNAIVTLVPERAREQAMAADAATARGETLGPLHGLPMAHKDLASTEGIRTTQGSPVYADHVPDFDDLIVARMRAAGGVQVGKTNTPEFGAGSQTFNEVFGATKNPWDTSRTCGGSSGGAAVALASGMVPLADGSDMGGSLRNPANFCNVVGLRPTPGRVPDWPTPSVWAPWGLVGPMGRTVDDVALLLSAVAGRDERAPLSIWEDGAVFTPPLSGDLSGLKIAWAPTLGGLPVAAEVREALDPVRGVMEGLGAHIDETCPDLSSAGEVFQVMRATVFAAKLGRLRDTKPELLKETLIWNLDEARRRPLGDMSAAIAEQASIHRTMMSFFDTYDLLACPVSQVAPFPVETEWITNVDGVEMSNYIEWMRSCSDITVTGSPAISVPAAFTPEGLPVGIQLVTRHGADVGLLRAAAALEAAIDIQRIPPLAIA